VADVRDGGVGRGFHYGTGGVESDRLRVVVPATVIVASAPTRP
jgi:hypothetical protein